MKHTPSVTKKKIRLGIFVNKLAVAQSQRLSNFVPLVVVDADIPTGASFVTKLNAYR